MRPPTGREQAVIGVLLTILIAIAAFKFGSSAKNVSNNAAKAPKAQKQATRAQGTANQAQAQATGVAKCLLNSRGPRRAARSTTWATSAGPTPTGAVAPRSASTRPWGRGRSGWPR